MGCIASSGTCPAPGPGPVLLSQQKHGKAHVDLVVTDLEVFAGVSDMDRRFIASLDEETVLESMGVDGGDRSCTLYSFGSEVDAMSPKRQASFGEKRSLVEKKDSLRRKQNKKAVTKPKATQSMVDPSKAGIGFACKKGLKRHTPNQDSWVVLKMDDFSIYGVFEGRGKSGHDVAHFVKEALPRIIVKDSRLRSANSDDVLQLLKDAHASTQRLISVATQLKKFDAKGSGCTSTLVIHDHSNNMLYKAWAGEGDSGAILAQDEDRPGLDSIQTRATQDSLGSLSSEPMRPLVRGVKLATVFAGTHGLGNVMGCTESGMPSAVPSLCLHRLEQEDKTLILCSDGVWDVFEQDEVVHSVTSFPKNQAMDAAQNLAKDVWAKWMDSKDGQAADDITIIIINLD